MGVGSSEALLTRVGHQFAVVACRQGVHRAVKDGVAVNERAEQALLPMLDGCPACCGWPASFAARRSP
jgi:uncharacterized metal-binding protein